MPSHTSTLQVAKIHATLQLNSQLLEVSHDRANPKRVGLLKNIVLIQRAHISDKY